MSEILYKYAASFLGDVLLLSNGEALTGFYFVGQKHIPTINPSWRQDNQLSLFKSTLAQVNEYTKGAQRKFDIPYGFQMGTPFQQKVWDSIAQVPYGQTLSYKKLAEGLGCPKSIRAVAAAVGKNPISLLIPCHRIIGTNGSLTGYAAGLDLKRALLALEKTSLP